MALVTGYCIIRVDGISIRSKAGAKLKFGGFKREPVFADGEYVGPQETPVAAEITADMVHTSETDIDRLRDLQDGVGIFETNTGQTWTLNNLFCDADSLELDAEGGAVSSKFIGRAAIKTS